ncbi:hypothetical protein Cst_c02850 [Thermoclostridium stercorarium subsp. stercorarium DSM 8532]|uniref:Uncharacterized protein n=1 Tax=Thermoclostridium stercorarium (strain ATCC 35414 / DSM 8532 / NCIMB 11754) TaxID=1121335 RepID=L7VKW8_THES1|nr:hypothetical protein Cst_c02850 [Thermoclostridium stercorarium subsp. stercorarium DSM 8532]
MKIAQMAVTLNSRSNIHENSAMLPDLPRYDKIFMVIN